MHLAARHGQAAVISKLHQLGADANQKDSKLCNAAHYAKNAEVIRALAEIGCDLNQEGLNEMTPAHDAVLEGNADVIMALSDHGADLTKKAYGTFSPLDAAILKHHPNLIQQPKAIIALIHCGVTVTPENIADLRKEEDRRAVEEAIKKVDLNSLIPELLYNAGYIKNPIDYSLIHQKTPYNIESKEEMVKMRSFYVHNSHLKPENFIKEVLCNPDKYKKEMVKIFSNHSNHYIVARLLDSALLSPDLYSPEQIETMKRVRDQIPDMEYTVAATTMQRVFREVHKVRKKDAAIKKRMKEDAETRKTSFGRAKLKIRDLIKKGGTWLSGPSSS